ncbi:MAG: LysR family transcriptional regulator [Salaquimonas sp.]
MDSITRMKAFIEVVEMESYSAAARKMGRSKALLSKYVRELEDELGTLLINRTTRQLSLTEAGQTYFTAAQDILQRIEDAQEAVRDSGKEVSGLLRVTAPRSLGASEAMLPLIAFAKQYPDIKLDVDLNDRVVDLVEERFDVAIRGGILTDSTLIARKLISNRLLFCASPAFLKIHGTPKEPKDIAELPNIIDTNWRGRNNWPFVDLEGKPFTQNVNSIMEANDPEVCKRAALEGLGVTMVPEFAVHKEIADGSLVSILSEYIPEGNSFHAVYAQRRHVSAKVRVFVDFMADWFKKKD